MRVVHVWPTTESQVRKMQVWWKGLFAHSVQARQARLQAMAEQARVMEEEIARQQAEYEAQQEEQNATKKGDPALPRYSCAL